MLIRLAAAGGHPISHIRVVAAASSFRRQTRLATYQRTSTRAFNLANSIFTQRDRLSKPSEGLTEAAAFRKSVADEEIHDIYSSYHALSLFFDKYTTQFIRSLIDSDSLVDALEILASAKPQAWSTDLMNRILSDLTKHFKGDIDARIYNRVIDGFLKRDDVRGAQQWLMDAQSKLGNCAPTQEQWSKLLTHCGAHYDTPVLRSVLQEMRHSGSPATAFTYRSLCRNLHHGDHLPPLGLVQALMGEMKKDGVPYDLLLKEFERMYMEADLHELAHEMAILRKLPQPVASTSLSQQRRRRQIHPDLHLFRIARTRGERAAVRLYRQLYSGGFRASEQTLMQLLSRVYEPSMVRFWEDVLQVRASAGAWSRVIINAINRRRLPFALGSYRAALASGVRPTNAMLHPIIRSLCTSYLHSPLDATIDRAVTLFQDFMRNEESHDSAQTPSPAFAPDTATYNALLRGLVSSPNTPKYGPIAVSLLEDMQVRNVPMDCMTTASFVIISMRLSSSVPAAFKAYRNICRSNAHKWKLDEEGYVAVLNAFSQLSMEFTGYPTTRLYMEIVRDMRMAGHHITRKVYTIFLQRLAALGRGVTHAGSRDETLQRLVRRIHNFINVDASLAPDIILWNQLMDTYQQCGCFTEALLLWDYLYISRQYGNASVSIVLDACAYHGSFAIANQIFTKLKENKFPLNVRNWNTWLECLCRLGRVDEASKVLCFEMGLYDGCAPDVESARIVLKFATNVGKDSQVRRDIRLHQPGLWERLPRGLQTGENLDQ